MRKRSLDLSRRKLRDGGGECIMMGWAAHVARIEEMRQSYNILVGNLKRTFGGIRSDGKRILGSVSEK
jgi:hypothetical protein